MSEMDKTTQILRAIQMAQNARLGRPIKPAPPKPVKTLRCLYGRHPVTAKHPTRAGEFVDGGFVCNHHLRLYEDRVDPSVWSMEEDVGE